MDRQHISCRAESLQGYAIERDKLVSIVGSHARSLTTIGPLAIRWNFRSEDKGLERSDPLPIKTRQRASRDGHRWQDRWIDQLLKIVRNFGAI